MRSISVNDTTFHLSYVTRTGIKALTFTIVKILSQITIHYDEPQRIARKLE